MEESPYQEFSAVTLNSLCVLWCIYSIHETPRQLAIGLFIGLFVIVMNQFGLFENSINFDFYVSYSAYVVFYGYAAFRLLRMIINTERVREGMLYAAVIVNLLIGVIGGYLFMIIENAIPESPSSINLASLRNPLEFQYFSSITLITVENGDLVPLNQVAQAL